MGGFYLILKNKSSKDTLNLIDEQKGLNVFYKKGLKLNKRITTAHFDIFTFYKKFHEVENTFFFDNNDFIIAVGTFFYKKKIGYEGITEFYNDYKNKKDWLTYFNGQYGLVLYIENELVVLNDHLGLYHIYYNTEQTIFSNSFLSVVKSVRNKDISTQELYEFIFTGTTYGNNTIYKNVKGLDREEIKKIFPTTTTAPKKLPALDYNGEKNLKALIELVASDLRSYFEMLKINFGEENISAALSGGYDTRLMLALMKNVNINPRLYVSGNKTSADVKIAKLISEKENLLLDVYYNEDIPKLSEDEFLEFITSKFYLNDGLSTKGLFLTTSKMDLLTTKKRLLNLNGGGGEIYRDFWKLLDKKYSLFKFVKSKYDIIETSFCSKQFKKEEYLSTLAQKIKIALKFSDDIITRQELDSIYPFFRIRFWMSGVNKRLNYLSNAIWPFADWEFAEKSKMIPVKYKFFGTFEAELIKFLSPQLAKYNSNYGFNFFDPLPIKYKLKTILLNNTPVALRPFLRKQKAKKRKQLPYYFSKEYLDPLVGKKPYYIESYIDTNYPDMEILSRIYTLELLISDRI